MIFINTFCNSDVATALFQPMICSQSQKVWQGEIIPVFKEKKRRGIATLATVCWTNPSIFPQVKTRTVQTLRSPCLLLGDLFGLEVRLLHLMELIPARRLS